jgi:hypothetical protein
MMLHYEEITPNQPQKDGRLRIFNRTSQTSCSFPFTIENLLIRSRGSYMAQSFQIFRVYFVK